MAVDDAMHHMQKERATETDDSPSAAIQLQPTDADEEGSDARNTRRNFSWSNGSEDEIPIRAATNVPIRGRGSPPLSSPSTSRSTSRERRRPMVEKPTRRPVDEATQARLDAYVARGAERAGREKEKWPLHEAIKWRREEQALELIAAGARVNEANEDGDTPLHLAAAQNYLELTQKLIAAGARLDALDTVGETPLHRAAVRNAERTVTALITAGASVDAKSKSGETPLHMAATRGALMPTQALLAAGACVDSTDEGGSTPLHRAAVKGATSVAAALIAAGARVDARAYERRNGDSKIGSTPLHLAALNNGATIAKVLIDAGAPINALDEDGETPLVVALASKGIRRGVSVEDKLETIQLLVANGATLPPPQADADEVLASNWESAAGWAEQRDRGIELTSLPIEVYERGASDIRAYFKSFTHQPASNANTLVSRAPAVTRADYRSKVCVVGPSTWGKTSFIKSFTNGQATLEDADMRTIGIDLFSWAFDVADTRRYHVTLWDFAGQDEYQSAHALFFSRRTLYVLCVNLRAYADAMASAKDDDDPEAHMAQFVDCNIIKWIRVICAHFPSASFVFVGTKADLIAHNPQVVQAIGDDLRRRLERNEQAIGDAIEREHSALLREQHKSDGDDEVNTRLRTLETLRSQRPRYLSTELLVVSSADLTGMQTLRERLEELIAQSETGFLMPPIYSQLHEHLREQATEAIDAYRSNGDVGALVERTFVSVDALYAEVKQTPTFQSLELDEWTAILHVLHDLGDLLWYDVDTESALVNTVFLSPSVVIDFVRCVVNHTLGRPEHAKSKIDAELFALVASEGRVKHKLLERLEMWRCVSRDTMAQLKELLWLFQLAYPHTSDGLKWDSDLVIPLYWKRDAGKAPAMEAPTLQWEYVFRVHLPETLFERFCVQNYAISASCDRQHARDWCRLRRDGVTDTLVHRRVVSVEGESFPAVAIAVTAQSASIAWRELVPFCMSMERLLEKYPGLWVSRYVVSSRGRRYDVDELVRERVEQERVKGGVASTSSSASTLSLLPPDMRWYMQRWWREREFARVIQTPDASVLQQIQDDMQRMLQAQERLEATVVTGFEETAAGQAQTREALMNMFAGATNRRLFPALWTLETTPHSTTKTVTLRLRIRSDLSGVCFHEPLNITVGDAAVAKYGGCIKAGLSVFSAVVPSFFGKGVVDAIASECQKQIDRTMAVHNLVQGLELPYRGSMDASQNQTLSPDATLALLVDLLRLICEARGRAFDPLQMAELSGLECGYLPATGDYVWAHRDEIQSRSNDIQFAHKSSSAVRSVQSASAVDSPSLPPLEPRRSVTSEPQCLSLRIVDVRGLRNGKSIGTQSPYCKWTLSSAESGVIAVGRTDAHKNGGTSPNWSVQVFAVRLQSCVKDATLVVSVRCAGVVPGTKTTLAEGSLQLTGEKLVKHGARSTEHTLPLVWRGAAAGVMTVALE